MHRPALVPAHVPLAEAARIAERHGFVLETVVHEGRVRIAMVRRARVGTPDSHEAPRMGPRAGDGPADDDR